MGRNPQRTSSWWLVVVLISVSTLPQGQLLYSGRNSHAVKVTYGKTHPEVYPGKEPSARPRPVAVKCSPDFMEVVVEADMFNTGLQVDGTHLRLGSALVGEESSCRAFRSGEDEFTIRAQLMDCGTKRSVS